MPPGFSVGHLPVTDMKELARKIAGLNETIWEMKEQAKGDREHIKELIGHREDLIQELLMALMNEDEEEVE